MQVVKAVFAFLLLTGITAAQTNPASSESAPRHQFDVASIRPAAVQLGHEGGNRHRIEHTPKSLSMWNVDLSECVQWAYGLAAFQVLAAHPNPDRFDIIAKSETSVPVSGLRMMLQDLLAARFKLSVHRETRTLPVYKLTIAKGGPKLRPATADSSRPQVHTTESLPRVQDDAFLFSGVAMPDFARMLMQLNGVTLPVIDATGIQGAFDIVLKFAPAAAREADTAALLSIVQE